MILRAHNEGMARDPHDVAFSKFARSVLTKKGVDLTAADLRVMHGVVYLKGSVALNRGDFPGGNLKQQVALAEHQLRQKPGIKDVIIDVMYKD